MAVSDSITVVSMPPTYNNYPAHWYFSCITWFQIDNWMGVFSIAVIDCQPLFPIFMSYADSVYSDSLASHVGTLETFPKNFGIFEYSFGCAASSFEVSWYILICKPQLCILAASGATLYASLTVIRQLPSSPTSTDTRSDISIGIPSLNNIRPCESDFPRTDVFYAVWVSFILFDTSELIPEWLITSGLNHVISRYGPYSHQNYPSVWLHI